MTSSHEYRSYSQVLFLSLSSKGSSSELGFFKKITSLIQKLTHTHVNKRPTTPQHPNSRLLHRRPRPCNLPPPVHRHLPQGGGGGVEFLFGTTLSRVEQDGDGVTVCFTTTTTETRRSPGPRRFDLVVGADGLQSTTRKLVWGEEHDGQRLHSLNFYSAFFSMPRGPTDTMWRRWYHAPGRRGIMVRPDQQRGRTTVFLGVLNETDEKFWNVCGGGGKEKKSDTGTTTKVQAQKVLIREYFQDTGWESERVLQGMMETEDFYYDMVAQVKMERFSKGRVVLLGDAG